MHVSSNSEMLRRFNYIGIRCLIHKLTQLQKLEVELFEQDFADRRSDEESLRCGAEYCEQGEALIARVEETWQSYCA
jgi:hypothetical protein